MDVVTSINKGLRLDVSGKELDQWAGNDESTHIRPAQEYRDFVWEQMHLPPHAKGRLMPWAKTHQDIQIRHGELILWAGKRLSSKSLIAGQVQLSVMSQGDRCVIASMEMPVEDTLTRMERQAIAVDAPSREYHDRFYDWATDKLWMYEQSGVVSAKRIIGLCKYSIAKLGIKQVVIDSLMMVGLPNTSSMHAMLQGQIEFTRELAQIAKETRAAIHLVCHRRKGQNGFKDDDDADDIAGAGGIADLASTIFMMRANRDKQDEINLPDDERKHDDAPDVWMRLRKNRRGQVGQLYGFWLDPKSLQLTESQGKRLAMVNLEAVR